MAGTSELKCLLEAEAFNEKMELYLRPLAKAEIVVKLPKITVPGQSISNWDLMERLKKIVNPIQFDAIKVRESSLESVIFETELLSKAMLRQAMKMLTGQTMKVAGFAELLQISIHEAKSDFPSRHDWDLFYMKNNLNETKPGERPDTIYLAKIPVKWFNDGKLDGPCEILLERAMAVFGRIRRVDVPICDPMRALMPQKFSGFQQKGFTFGQEVLFEAYVQYEEYSGFEAAMNALRNMKWVKKIDGKIFQANVKVDFDRSGHLSEAVIDRREAERSRLVDEKRRELEAELNAKEEEERKQRLADLEKLRRQEEREQKRRQKRDEERRREEEHRRKEEERKTREQADKEEDRRYRQKTILQSQRLLECVFSRIEAKENRRKLEFEEDMIQQKSQLDELDGEDKEQALRNVLLLQRERDLREKLFEKMAGRATQPKSVEEPESNHEAENGRRKHKKSSRKHKNRHSRSSSSSSSSRSRSRSSRRHQKKKKKHRHRSRSR